MPLESGRCSRLFAGIAIFFCCLPILAQKNLSGVAKTKLALDRLNVLGNVLMIAAHPDDENTALLALLARGRKYRTAYLSLTRGEGGQNLIGSEQGDELGVIRTQELIAARQIDGAEQFFTRAIDFGFSKTADETLSKWGREQVLSDTVWVIRKFQPDVIVLRFSGTPRDGHGQHQASAIIGKEAFSAAADPSRFPEQLKYVKPWQATRLMINLAAFTPDQIKAAEQMPDKAEIDLGAYDPILGYSFGEIAGMSRSQHRSQAMGAAESRGSMKNYLVTIAGDKARKEIFEHIDTTWARVPGGQPAGALLDEAARTFDPVAPEKSIPLLLKARTAVAKVDHPLAKRKRVEIDEAIGLCGSVPRCLRRPVSCCSGQSDFRQVDGAESFHRDHEVDRGDAPRH
jgi:LmbE family N-acetylglucosaminyl deacetylase